MKIFLLGAGVGAIAGMLIAPEKGRTRRAKIAENIRDWSGRTQRPQGESQARSDGQDVWEKVRQQQAGPERRVTEEAEKESEAVAEVLNTAKRDELLSVPGIGRGTAKRIIKNRPYESQEEVLEEGVMPEETLERVKEELVEKKRDIAS